tara:strand:+ start:20166 stop:20537 length:372 start_codon:yes stop_codon:yes gene_type:complete
MRRLLQLLLLMTFGVHAVLGCAAHCRCEMTIAGLNLSRGDSIVCDHVRESGLPSGCCECGQGDCVWVYDGDRAELPLTSKVCGLLRLPQHNVSALQCRLATAAWSAALSEPRTIRCRYCVWLI